MRKLHLIILIISIFVAGCSTKSTRNAFLMHVDSLQRTNPDSAFNLLYENNTLFTTLKTRPITACSIAKLS